jgi:hypothetical protein
MPRMRRLKKRITKWLLNTILIKMEVKKLRINFRKLEKRIKFWATLIPSLSMILLEWTELKISHNSRQTSYLPFCSAVPN